MKPESTLPPKYFDDVYTAKEDPWEFETSDYEKEKYRATIAALPKAVYENVFEVGCSIGVLTKMLAPRCRHLMAVDASELPLAKARKRLEGCTNVEIRQMAIPDEFPEDNFDLVLVSEVAYYFSKDDLHRTISRILTHLVRSGQLLIVHWTPPVADYPLTGDEVHDVFRQYTGEGQPLTLLTAERHEKYRLDLFEKL